MQVGGTDHNVVARHWISLGFICFNIYQSTYLSEEKVSKTASSPSSSSASSTLARSPHFSSPPLCYKSGGGTEEITKKEGKGGARFSPHSSDLFSLFSKFLPVTL